MLDDTPLRISQLRFDFFIAHSNLLSEPQRKQIQSLVITGQTEMDDKKEGEEALKLLLEDEELVNNGKVSLEEGLGYPTLMIIFFFVFGKIEFQKNADPKEKSQSSNPKKSVIKGKKTLKFY